MNHVLVLHAVAYHSLTPLSLIILGLAPRLVVTILIWDKAEMYRVSLEYHRCYCHITTVTEQVFPVSLLQLTL